MNATNTKDNERGSAQTKPLPYFYFTGETKEEVEAKAKAIDPKLTVVWLGPTENIDDLLELLRKDKKTNEQHEQQH
jgi:hypothetical protein